jgi:formylglycine-generating enzyme
MSAVVDSYRDEMDMSYAVDFGRDREPAEKRSRFPEYRRKGSAPARVNGIHCRRTKRWTWGSGRGARMLNARAFAGCLAFAVAGLASAAFGVTIDYTEVGSPGNTAQGTTGWGSVSSVFKISTKETTNAQYVDFLNKVDGGGSNPNGVYNSLMSTDPLGGISFTGTAASGSKYAVKSGTAPSGVAYTNMPVVFTSWFSAARFANWLQNGQTTGTSGMETGAYTLNGQTSGNAPARNLGAQVWLPSRDEWYKAAFYSGTGSSYFTWQNASNTQPANNVTNLSLANAANYGSTSTPTTNPIAVGSYTNSSTSPYGLYDAMGNATEYTDTANGSGQVQVFGGSWATTLAQASLWNANASAIFRSTAVNTSQLGFRVAAVPEPTTIALAGMGLAGLAGLDWMKRRRKKAAASRIDG